MQVCSSLMDYVFQRIYFCPSMQVFIKSLIVKEKMASRQYKLATGKPFHLKFNHCVYV